MIQSASKRKLTLSHISPLGTELDILCKYLLLNYIMLIHSFIHSFIQRVTKYLHGAGIVLRI